MTETKMYNVALIGCGRISFKHIEGFVDNAQKIKLTAVSDPVKKRVKEKVTEYQKKLYFKDVFTYSKVEFESEFVSKYCS